ncbi:MAG: hypothetical protein PHH83_00240 [Patescibacteria group bacterium]|nr:hypothetical protein [Patescibacteria group bacterium]
MSRPKPQIEQELHLLFLNNLEEEVENYINGLETEEEKNKARDYLGLLKQPRSKLWKCNALHTNFPK